jgi:hypothetical protein
VIIKSFIGLLLPNHLPVTAVDVDLPSAAVLMIVAHQTISRSMPCLCRATVVRLAQQVTDMGSDTPMQFFSNGFRDTGLQAE